MRRIVTPDCEGGWIAATVDGPVDATRGWVLVTGGSQTRTGPHRLYERLAALLAARGEAVIRFDRRGVGDSPGEDRGFEASAPEIAVAARALRDHAPGLTEMSGFGLCDGATALALHGGAAGIGRLVLANPWVVEPRDDLPPAAAIRGHYRRRLADPAAWRRLIGGGVDLRRLAQGLIRGTREDRAPLAARVAEGTPDGSRIVLAAGDGTAQAFRAAWRRLAAPPMVEMIDIPTPAHSFAPPAAFAALAEAVQRG
jgi:pimeloyl-ACP methyl ester carboxylesterase